MEKLFKAAILIFGLVLAFGACSMKQAPPPQSVHSVIQSDQFKQLIQSIVKEEMLKASKGKPLTLDQIKKLATIAGATNFYGATARTGGASGSLDSIDGTNLANGDGAYVIESANFFIYYLDATSGAGESDPDIIAPDANGGNKRWLLVFQGDAETAEIAQLAVTDGNFIVGDGSTWVAESANTARTSLGLGTGDSPQFTAVTEGANAVPNATDNLSFFAATTSAQLFGVLSDETGSSAGALAVFSISPAFTTAITIQALTGASANLYITADAAEDNNDKWRIVVADGGNVTLESYTSGAWVAKATFTNAGNLTVTGTLYGATYGSDGSVSDVELKYINTLSSNAQSQLDVLQTALSNSAGLLASLGDGTGTGLSVFNNFPTLIGLRLSAGISGDDNLIARPVFKDYGETVSAIGSDTTPECDLEDGNVFTDTVDTGETTYTFSNPPASGTAGSFTLILTNGGSQTVNWPASVDWAGGDAPTLTASGVDIITFITTDGGTTWYGFAAGLDMQ